MRIGFDAKRAFNNNSGLGNYSRFFIQALQDFSDEELYLYTPKISRQHNTFLEKLVSNRRFPTSFVDRKIPALWRSNGILKDLQKDKIDLFHGLSHELPLGISKKGIATVLTFHDLIYERFPHLYSKIDLLTYRSKYRKSAETADRIIAITEQTKQDLIDYYDIPQEKIKVVYQDCMTMFHTLLSEEHKNHIQQKYNLPDRFMLCVGTIEERKNQLLLLKSLKNIEEEIPLVIVGRKRAYYEVLEKYITSNNLHQRVVFIDQADFIDFPAIYQLATLFLYPSIFEGFGIPILEAQNSGIPVITSLGSCFPETGGEGAVYNKIDNEIELATNINRILSDNLYRKSLIIKGFENTERFRANKSVPQVLDIYRTALELNN